MSTEDTHDSLSVPRVRINCTHEIDQTKSKGFFNRITCCRPVLTFEHFKKILQKELPLAVKNGSEQVQAAQRI